MTYWTASPLVFVILDIPVMTYQTASPLVLSWMHLNIHDPVITYIVSVMTYQTDSPSLAHPWNDLKDRFSFGFLHLGLPEMTYQTDSHLLLSLQYLNIPDPVMTYIVSLMTYQTDSPSLGHPCNDLPDSISFGFLYLGIPVMTYQTDSLLFSSPWTCL